MDHPRCRPNMTTRRRLRTDGSGKPPMCLHAHGCMVRSHARLVREGREGTCRLYRADRVLLGPCRECWKR